MRTDSANFHRIGGVDVSGSNLGPETGHPDRFFRSFAQYLYANFGTVLKFWPRPIPYVSFTTSYSCVIYTVRRSVALCV
jgi:hypothetical protein